jgi:hypothetical protein
MSLCKLRTPWPIHFKFHRVIGIDGLTVCALYGKIEIPPKSIQTIRLSIPRTMRSLK